MKLKTLFKKTKKIFLDLFFPINCLGCGKFDQWICDDCHKTFPILTEQHCPICEKEITQNGEVCLNCQKYYKINLKGVFIISIYKDALLKKSIHHFKYKFIEKISEPLALLIAQALQNSEHPIPDLIIPVPLHKQRLRWRGFNQSESLARDLDLKIPIVTNSLIRKNNTIPQVKMKNRKQRLENLNDAFCVENPEIIKNKKILLIDDIITTGTTLSVCAKILKQVGAEEVRALVIAWE
ncbi:MAG: ComF family protein [Candidatus Moranbacteria bacterium]|nr:ComF family protein [Candidatus Moranbacteria bacterium]